MKRYVLAISGGVDSVVLLDMFSKKYHPTALIIAHFEHGIRNDSAADERFVVGLAAHYGVHCEVGHGHLGQAASEDTARRARYEFLRRVASKHNATIVTAHHADDLVETIAINIHRGTGWRGLAVFGAKDVYRPLLGLRKRRLYEYARVHELEWVEDHTNHEMHYLRNRLRARNTLSDATVGELTRLSVRQRALAIQIADSIARLPQGYTVSRYVYIMVSTEVAYELLRAVTAAKLTRPQSIHLLHAIKTAKPGTRYTVGGLTITFALREFIVNH